jgi:hypothetical protein
MSIVATQGARGRLAVPVQGRIAPGKTDLSNADPAEHARSVRVAIDHHRAELAKLYRHRRRHAAALHAAGWQFAPIGRLYQLTRERIRQLVVSARAADDSEGVA